MAAGLQGLVSMTQRSYRVLIIDDDTEILRVFSKILQLEGFVTETAANGARGTKQS